MKADDILEALKYLALLATIVTPTYLLLNKKLQNKREHDKAEEENALKIGIEKARQNSVGEDEIKRMTLEMEKMSNNISEQVAKLWLKFQEHERDWDKYKKEQRENFDRQSALVLEYAQTLVKISKEWREGIDDAGRHLRERT